MNSSPNNENTHVVQLTAPLYGGETLGRLADGRAVFVPFAIPGETVRLRLVEEKRGYARGELLDVLEPSPDRIQPRCAHFSICGGCHYQHVAYAQQIKIKEAILRDQLERIGRIPDPPVQPAVASSLPFNYRNQVQFHLTEDNRLGYHQARSEEVFAIKECHLPEEVINQIWPQLDVEAFPGLDKIVLRSGMDGDLLLALVSEGTELPEFSLEELDLSAIILGSGWNQVLAGSGYIYMEILGRKFRVSAGAFFQVNTRIATSLISHLIQNLEIHPGDTLMDVYAGVGLFSAFLAAQVDRLIAIEVSPEACADFRFNLDEFDNVELYQATAEETLKELDVGSVVMLVDPPRAGIDKKAMDGIRKIRPRQLAYISCDPATLGRDAGRLVEGGYQLIQVTPFDMFPQTYHIESLSLWESR